MKEAVNFSTFLLRMTLTAAEKPCVKRKTVFWGLSLPKRVIYGRDLRFCVVPCPRFLPGRGKKKFFSYRSSQGAPCDVTDESRTDASSPVIFSEIYDGERCDSRPEQERMEQTQVCSIRCFLQTRPKSARPFRRKTTDRAFFRSGLNQPLTLPAVTPSIRYLLKKRKSRKTGIRDSVDMANIGPKLVPCASANPLIARVIVHKELILGETA